MGFQIIYPQTDSTLLFLFHASGFKFELSLIFYIILPATSYVPPSNNATYLFENVSSGCHMSLLCIVFLSQS